MNKNVRRLLRPAPDRIASRARAAVFGYFVLNGFVMGVWASGLPALDERIGLGPARLGTVLLLVSGGALCSMLVAGRLIDRFGSVRVCRIAGPVSAVVLLGPAMAPSYPLLAVAALVFGLGLGCVEVSMNAHSVEVEARYGRPIVSAFHGTWSLGGAAAGGLTALSLHAGDDGQALLFGAGLLVPFGFMAATRWLLPEQAAGPEDRTDHPGGGTTALRWGLVALLGLVAFAGHVSEGAAMDWAALHTRWVLEADPAMAPLAYTVFSVAMTTVRLLGDPIRARLGSARTLQFAGVCATSGYALVLASTPLAGSALGVPVAWTGWVLAGIGLATVVPVVFSAVGASGGAVGRALSLVTACGYTGLMMGPAVLGFVAEHTSLPVALVIPALLALVVAIVGAPAVRRLPGPAARDRKDDAADAEPAAGYGAGSPR